MSGLKHALLKANHLLEERAEESYTDHDFSGKRVLVVEDNELNREIATEILEGTGFTVEVAIRSLNRRDNITMPILAMTANAFAEDKALALKCGMNGHIAKSLDIRAVFRILHEHLEC